jgi:hypothetical protein
MERRGWWLWLIVMGWLTPGLPAAAQDRPQSRFELGIGGGGETSLITNGADLRLRISVPRDRGRSVEAFVGGYRGTNGFDAGVYGLQVKRPVAWRRRPGVEPFATMGAMGLITRYGSRDCPLTCQAHDTIHVLPPFIGLVGGGVQYTVASRLAVRIESQVAIVLVVPIGVRVAAGVSIPLGRGTFRDGGSR